MLVRVLALTLSFSLVADIQAESLRDPTKPPTWAAQAPQAAAPVASNGQLQSILVSKDKRVAIIGGQSFETGAALMGSKIKRIERDAVWLADGRKLVLFPKLGVQL
ncbi:hypothetical protein [Ferrimonas futtsuensis]|uniref:hypothetical protein n=1 Tax=Ferrimonas futtsuensis TaxID=364764 RepID=UPI0003F700FE|nr:hypothetical protein [Ferrimonas futtsuensis]